MTEPIFPIPAAAVRNAQAELRPLAGGIDHPECVAWFEGRVYCGTESGQVLAIDPETGETSVVATPGGFGCGIAFDHQGRCWYCDVGQGRVLRLGRDWAVEAAWDVVEGQRLHTPNFPAVARDGTVWIADSGSSFGADDGFLFRIDPDDRAAVVDRSCGRFPNGIALSVTDPAGNVGSAVLTVLRGSGTLEVGLSASAYRISAARLPRTIVLTARVTNPDGNVLSGELVTFTLSIPGVPAITGDDVSDGSGMATFQTIIPAGATVGSGLATAFVITADFGEASAQISITLIE